MKAAIVRWGVAVTLGFGVLTGFAAIENPPRYLPLACLCGLVWFAARKPRDTLARLSERLPDYELTAHQRRTFVDVIEAERKRAP